MPHLSLETIAERLSEQLRCEQEDLCRPIVQQVTRGKPVAPAALRASLQVSQNELEQRLAKLPPDVEFDRAGNIVGLGATLVPLTRVGFLGRLLPFALALAMCGFAPSPLDPLSFPLFESLLFFEFGSGAGLARRGQGRGPRLRLQAALGQWLVPEHRCQQH